MNKTVNDLLNKWDKLEEESGKRVYLLDDKYDTIIHEHERGPHYVIFEDDGDFYTVHLTAEVTETSNGLYIFEDIANNRFLTRLLISVYDQ